jgi:hypothetical protein
VEKKTSVEKKKAREGRKKKSQEKKNIHGKKKTAQGRKKLRSYGFYKIHCWRDIKHQICHIR